MLPKLQRTNLSAVDPYGSSTTSLGLWDTLSGHAGKNGTVQDYCDWCYGKLSPQDRAEYFNRFLSQVDAYACSSCIRSGRVLDPPESLEVSDTMPSDAWRTAAVAIFDQDSNGDALELLRKAAGFQ